jgi:hypothetical protein
MPQIIYKDFKNLLFDLFIGTGTRPVTIYMGLRTDGPGAANTLASVSEIGSFASDGVTSSGYVRKPLTTSAMTRSTSGAISTLSMAQVTFPSFTAIPNPNSATHWFLCSALSGTTGSLYASGPLNPAVVTGLLSAAAAAGQPVLSMPTSIATSLLVYDYLNLGSACANNAEIVQIASFGTASGSNTPVTLVQNLVYLHPSGESFNRDGSLRVYPIGYVEKVTASLQLN